MAAESNSLEQVADELYGLPPGEFTEARDALVKRLRADKQGELANEVKALRRPTVAAWALNQLVRNRRKDVEALLKAADELRAAQEELVAGGDRSRFQKAAAQERELVAKLARDAASLAAEAGVGSSQGLEDKLVSTLHAAALDEGTAAELGVGRLLRERQAVAGFGGFEPAAAPSRPAPKPAKRTKPPKEDAADRERRAAEEARAREQLSAARLEERRAGRERDAAAEAAERAAGRVGKAEERAAEAARRLEEARAELEEAQAEERGATERHESARAEVAAAEQKLG